MDACRLKQTAVFDRLCTFEDVIFLLLQLFSVPFLRLIYRVCAARDNESPSWRILRRRRAHGSRNLPVGAGDVYQELACRVWIQGKGSAAGKTTKEGMRNALNHLSERSPEKLNGLRKTYHIHRTFYFSGAGAFEKQLCSNFQSFLSSLGRVLCGDEKLFRFTGKGRIVRKVPTSLPRLEFGTTKQLGCFQLESRFWCTRGCMVRQVTWKRAPRPQVLSEVGRSGAEV